MGAANAGSYTRPFYDGVLCWRCWGVPIVSIEAVSWALSVPVGGTAKVVLIGLANHAHADGTSAYPAIDRLAAYAHCDRRTVQRNLRKLEEGGWIVGEGQTKLQTTLYRLPLDRGGGILPPPADEGATSRDEGATSRDERGGTSAALTVNNRQQPSTPDRACADASNEVPKDFPSELRPHARSVMSVLREMATRHGAKEVTARAVALTVMANSRKALVAEAYAMAAYYDTKPVRDVTATYRNWLKRADTFAVVERLDERGLPAGSGPRTESRGAPASGRKLSGMEQALANHAEIQRLKAAGEVD